MLNELIDDYPAGIACNCEMCEKKIDYKIIRRGDEEYIILGSQLLTNWIINVNGSENANFYLHERILFSVESKLCRSVTTDDLLREHKTDLWPLQAGVFDPETVVDLYRAMISERDTHSSL